MVLINFLNWNDDALPYTQNACVQSEVKRGVDRPSSYKILRNLVSPAKPGDKSFAELVEALYCRSTSTRLPLR